MIQTTRLHRYPKSGSQALAQIRQVLVDADFLVIQSFDLQMAKAAQSTCVCPNHGTESCDCQMYVLQVYTDSGQQVTLIVHGYDGTTILEIVDTPVQRPDVGMVKLLGSILDSIPEDEHVQAGSTGKR